MAVIHYSALVTGIKGRTRGAIFQSGPGGQIVRSAGGFNRTAGTRWQALKHQTGVLAQFWGTLTLAEKAAWNSMSANTPSKNRFGEKRLTSGYNLFMKANKKLLATGVGLITTPPQQQALTNWTGMILVNPVYNFLSVLFPTVLQTYEILIIEASAPLRNGRRLPPGGFKQIGTFFVSIPYIQNLYPSYNAVYGDPVPGMDILVKETIININTGQTSVPIVGRITPIP